MMFKNLKSALEERENVTALKITIKETKLPEELFHFPHLRELYLEAPALKALPDDISGWSELALLQLRAPAFKGSLAPLFHLPKLSNLKTAETPLHPLRLAIGGSKAPLRFLTLKDAGLKALPDEFGELTTIEELHLPGNLLQVLPETFKQLKRLKWINLDSNELEVFPEVLARLPQLKHLSLDSNSFPEEEKERIQRKFNLTVS